MSKTKIADAIIVAAGSGSRFGGAKQFAELNGMAIYRHSLRTFRDHPMIRTIILVVSNDVVEKVIADLVLHSEGENVLIVVGGASRQDSVWNGMQKLEDLGGSEIVLVHDAARPFLEAALITSVILGIEKHGAALAAIPSVDTLKRAEAGFSVKTIPREHIWRAQTPQGARYEMLKSAFGNAIENRIQATDEAELLEQNGINPHLVMGDATNVKITFPDDLHIHHVV
ncbi:MAG: 2-C-methyl-D-erythritol 4-phosphate cytidylyltransferase [Ignavibacteriota bacterium]